MAEPYGSISHCAGHGLTGIVHNGFVSNFSRVVLTLMAFIIIETLAALAIDEAGPIVPTIFFLQALWALPLGKEAKIMTFACYI